MNRLLIQLPDDIIVGIDDIRGNQPRAAWIREAIQERLLQAAAAPLVPQVIPGKNRDVLKWSPPTPPKPLIEALVESVEESKAKKGRACSHSETRYKFGKPYCVKCGEFV